MSSPAHEAPGEATHGSSRQWQLVAGMAAIGLPGLILRFAGIHPEPILAARISRDALQSIKCSVLDKICAIDFAMAQQELLPYIPPYQRDALNEARWEEMTLNVAQTVQRWVTNSLQGGSASAETK